MTQPAVIRSSATIEDALTLMRNQNVRALVVAKCHEDGCYSILTEQTIVYRVAALGVDPAHIRVGTLMQQANIQLTGQMDLQSAAQHLADAEASWALVLEDNKLVGVVSITDVLHQLYRAPATVPEPPLQVWRSPRQNRQRHAGTAQRLVEQPEALLILEDDMRSGCKTMF